HFALDEPNHRALVTSGDGRSRAPVQLVSIDLDSGASTAIDGGGGELVESRGIALDRDRNRALVTAFAGPGSVDRAAVGLPSGTRPALLTLEAGHGPTSILDGITVDAASARAISVDWLKYALGAVDLASGARTTISDEGLEATPVLGEALVLDATAENALV